MGWQKRESVDRPEVAAWKAAYRELDNSAVLALVPVLDAMIERAHRSVEEVAGYEARHDQSMDFTAAHLQQAMTLQEQGVDVAQYVATAEKHADNSTALAARQRRDHHGLLAYRSDLVMRRHWILTVELCRRGLLTDPDEFLPMEPQAPST